MHAFKYRTGSKRCLGGLTEKGIATTQGEWYTRLMDRPRQWKRVLGLMVAALLLGGASEAAFGNGVFQGFLHHIAQQITRDKVDFALAESCTSWFYDQLQKPPPFVPMFGAFRSRKKSPMPVPADTMASTRRVRLLRTANPPSR